MAHETIINGTLGDPDPVNNNFIAAGKIQQVYVGTGFDVNNTSGPTDLSANHEFTVITAANLGNADYIKISAMVYTDLRLGDDSVEGGKAYLTIQSKNVGGIYTDIISETIIHQFYTSIGISDSMNLDNNIMSTITACHKLTDDEKSDGVQIKIIGRLLTIDLTSNMYLLNKQTVITTNA